MTDSSDSGAGSPSAGTGREPAAYDGREPAAYDGREPAAGGPPIFGGTRAGAIPPAGATAVENGPPAPAEPNTDASDPNTDPSGRHSHLGTATAPADVAAQPTGDPVGAYPSGNFGSPFGLPPGPVRAPGRAPGNGPRPEPEPETEPSWAPPEDPMDAQYFAALGQPRLGPSAVSQGVAPSGAYTTPSNPPPTNPPPANPLSTNPPLSSTVSAGRPRTGALPTKDQPRPESLLVPSHRASGTPPAQDGWQGRLRRMTGGLIAAQPSAQELADRRDARDIQHTFSRPMTVVVVQPKGGAGKTPTTIGLASALGSLRGGYVVGWDDNETRGTLAVRVDNADRQSTTVWDLLGDLASFERTDARVGDLSHYVRTQGAAQFDALVSDDSPGNMAQIGESEFQRLHTVLQRFYRQIVIDTGNNVRSPNWQAAVNAADQIVVVSTYQRDVGYSGSWVLDHLIETGRAELAASAITVLTAADPRQDPGVRAELIEHFGQRTRTVVEIPYDPLIALGGPIEWLRLKPDTRRAWVHAGAAVVNALAAQDGA